MGAELKEFDGKDDHVRLLVAYPPKLSISRLVNSLKLVSARLLRKRDFPEVRRKLWGSHFWTPSYYAGSCGGASLQTVKRYIQTQRLPQAPDRRRQTRPKLRFGRVCAPSEIKSSVPPRHCIPA